MRTILATAVIGTMLVVAPATQSTRDSHPSASLERAFAPNGRISMDLSAGEYRITAGTNSRIRLDWSARDLDRLSQIRTRADVQGRDAVIRTSGPDNSSFRVAIEVPMRADLYVRLSAGDLSIEGVEGSKDVALHAGELTIDVGRAEDYGRVEASVWAGEVNAPPYNVRKGGLFRSFDWRGDGPYHLKAHLKAGEVRLRSGS